MRDLDEGEELFVKYDITVDGDGLKSALKTALSLGQIFSGKSRREFAKEVKPYLKVLTSQMFKKPFFVLYINLLGFILYTESKNFWSMVIPFFLRWCLTS